MRAGLRGSDCAFREGRQSVWEGSGERVPLCASEDETSLQNISSSSPRREAAAPPNISS